MSGALYPSRWSVASKLRDVETKKKKFRDEINEIEMKRIQRTVEYTSKSGHESESARGASSLLYGMPR